MTAPRTRFTVVAVLACLIVVAVAAGTPWSWTRPSWMSGSPTPAPLPSMAPIPIPTMPPQPVRQPSGGFHILPILLVIGGIALAVLAALVVRQMLRWLRVGRETGESLTLEPEMALAAEGDLVPDLREAVADAHEELAPNVPPRDAIVAAWVALEEAAEGAGARRDPAQTPTEFTVAVLDRTAASPAAVTVLRNLYHRARFTERPVDPRDVTAAREALDRIGADLAAERAARTADEEAERRAREEAERRAAEEAVSTAATTAAQMHRPDGGTR